jgi:hypothetical protein
MTDLFTAQEPKKNQIVLEQFMTPPEICRALKVPAHVIKYAMDKGQLDVFAINGRIKLRTEEVTKFIEERAKQRDPDQRSS